MVHSVAVFLSTFTLRMNYPLFHGMDFIDMGRSEVLFAGISLISRIITGLKIEYSASSPVISTRILTIAFHL